MLCCLSCQPSPHTPIHKGIHKEGREAPPFVEAAEIRLLYGWVVVNICKMFVYGMLRVCELDP